MAKPKSRKGEIFIESVPILPEDERLDKLFDEMEQGSLKTLEDAAKQIVTLSTTLLGAFLGLLAFKDVPFYLEFIEIKVIATLALISFTTSLFYALQAVSPRQYTFPRANLTVKRRILEEMLARKHGITSRALWLFGFGMFLMLVAALDILFRV